MAALEQKKTSPPAHVTTRSSIECPIFGAPVELKKQLLPSKSDVLKQMFWTKHQIEKSSDAKQYQDIRFRVINKTIHDIVFLWKKASIPTVSEKRIGIMLNDLLESYRTIMKPYSSRKDIPSYQDKLKQYGSQMDTQLFDIAYCKCRGGTCGCEKSMRVPVQEKPFLLDQRTERKMSIGGVDIQTTQTLEQRRLRRQQTAMQMQQTTTSSASPATSISLLEIEDDQEGEVPAIEATNDYDEPQASCSSSAGAKEACKQMRTPLPRFAEECDRWNLSDRAAGAIASALLTDLGLITPGDSKMIIDPSKVRREREKVRHKLQNEIKPKFSGLYFDGRRDDTKTSIEIDGKHYPRTQKEEHYVLISEPDNHYLGHVAPRNGTSEAITSSIMTYFSNNDFDSDNIIAVGCDNTNVNTGTEGGVIRRLEHEFGHEVQWLTCMLHINELPLRHLIMTVDGTTHGPNAFSGPIGKQLGKCFLPIVNFTAIPGEPLPEIDIKNLSNDQQYLHQIYGVITTGNCPPGFANKTIGPVVHSRWLTTAARILRMYISTATPSQNLCGLTRFIINVYIPVWFSIKTKPSCIHGSQHFYMMIKKSRYCLFND